MDSTKDALSRGSQGSSRATGYMDIYHRRNLLLLLDQPYLPGLRGSTLRTIHALHSLFAGGRKGLQFEIQRHKQNTHDKSKGVAD